MFECILGGTGSEPRDPGKKRMRKSLSSRDVGRGAGEKGSDVPTSTLGGVDRDEVYEAAEHTTAPLDPFMTRLMAQELPIMDSTSRQRVNTILREWEGPQITDPADLPEEIRRIMDL